MGWQVEYDGLTYAIVNGAGHMVPSDKPHAAYYMFNSFIGVDAQILENEDLFQNTLNNDAKETVQKA